MSTPSNPAPPSPEAPGAPMAGPAAPRSGGATRWLIPALALVAAIVVGLFGGILIGQNTASANQLASGRGAFPAGVSATNRAGGGFGGGGQGNATAGTIVSISGDTIVVKTRQGTTVTVTATDATTVTESKAGNISDLKAGDTVTAIGQNDGSGNVKATVISEGSLGFGGFGGQRPSGTSTNGANN
jgi:hypothetical protein